MVHHSGILQASEVSLLPEVRPTREWWEVTRRDGLLPPMPAVCSRLVRAPAPARAVVVGVIRAGVWVPARGAVLRRPRIYSPMLSLLAGILEGSRHQL